VVSISLGSLSWGACDVLCRTAEQQGASTYDACLKYASSQFQVCMYPDFEIVDRANVEFMKLGTRGVTALIATGDGGCHFSFGPFPPDALGKVLNKISCANSLPTFPSESPYVTAVGGMALDVDGKTPIGCDTLLGCIVTGGGGFSWNFPMPDYQASYVSQYLSLPQNSNLQFAFNQTNRAYPDVATIATNVPLILNGQLQVAGGTSAAAPEFAGMISLINDARLNKGMAPLGFLNPMLYKVGNQGVFFDIVKGSTRCGVSVPGTNPCCAQGFDAAPGWDGMSGLGMAQFPQLLAALTQN